jgi:hypothetical protein
MPAGLHLFVLFFPLGEPEEVPCRDKVHMATSHGLVLNEIHRSPDVFLDCIVKLLGLCLDLDVDILL